MKTVKNIPQKIKATYGVGVTKNEIHVHHPAFINIERDSKFRIESGEFVLKISNSKIIVTLWKNVINMHISVLP